MAISDYEAPSEDEVWDHIHRIPKRYELCAQGKHNWAGTEWTGYLDDAGEHETKDPNEAAWFAITQACVRDSGGQRGCGEKRHFQSVYNRGAGQLERFTEFSYSDRNPLLVSPPGISKTGISVRSTMPNITLTREIFKPRVHLAPTGATKRALARSA